jgi:glycosyltransferase involved in cell wall biosynthesis
MYTRKGRRSILESLLFGLASFRLLWAPDFDVLDVDQFPFTPFFAAKLVCRLRRRPMTATWYEVWDRDYWRSYMGWLGPVGFFLQRFAARSADLIFADSKLTATRLTDWLGVDVNRVVVLPPGVSPSPSENQPSPFPLRGGPGRGSDSPAPSGGGSGRGQKSIDCIFVGRLLSHKNVDLMLEALAELPGVTGMIIGSGPEKQQLIALAEKLGITDRVRFEPAATREAVLEHLSHSRLLVFPSTREGFGLAVLEANAVGVPALVVNHPDNAAVELVGDGRTGLICELDVQSVTDRIRRYLADEPTQVQMSQAASAAARRYSWDAYVSRMESALADLIAPMEKAA